MSFMAWLVALAGIAVGFASGWAVFAARLARAEAGKEALTHRLNDQQKAHSAAAEQLKLVFENTGNKIFENLSNKFSGESEKKIGNLLNPLRERLGEFQKSVTDVFSQHGKEQHSLKAEIEKIVRANDGLTKALRGDVKAQGNWGEVMLERILEASGLRKGEDYIVQGMEMGLSSADGGRLRPDVIINLPQERHIIVDSKVSLTAYERYCSETDETAKAVHLKDFLKSVRAHVAGLAQKRYQHTEKLNSPDVVLMFMPIEGAYSFAMQHDPAALADAWDKNIVIAGPNMLFVMLRSIASVWNSERQNRNVLEIARQGGALYDKFAGFVEDMESIGKQMGRLNEVYDQAFGKLSKGKGNLISRVESLRQLGAKASKSLPVAEDAVLIESEEPQEYRELQKEVL